jgi:iron complex outermembrane receptor protein
VRGYLANAEKVRSAGIEADFKIRPSDRFTAYANAAYTDAKYVKFSNAPCPPELFGAAKLVATPASLQICWARGQVYLGIDGNYRSDWNSNASPSITKVEGYA